MNSLQILHYQLTFVGTMVILSWVYWFGIDSSLQKILLLYFFLDLGFFFTLMKPDMLLHHILSILLTMFCYQPYDVETQYFILTEVSTPFLVLYRLHVYEKINQILFLVFFFYFRIFQIGQVLIQHRYELEDYRVWLSFFLYCLNCYWLEMIVRHHLVNHCIKENLKHIVSYSHGISFLVLFQKQYNLVSIMSFFSSLASYLWHQYKTLNFYVIDLLCFHLLSFSIHWNYVPVSLSTYKLVSLPFHIADVVFYYSHHQLWLALSIGYDVSMVFFHYKKDFLWLLGWFIIFLILSRQTFGYGSTQTVVHLLIAYLFYNL